VHDDTRQSRDGVQGCKRRAAFDRASLTTFVLLGSHTPRTLHENTVQQHAGRAREPESARQCNNLRNLTTIAVELNRQLFLAYLDFSQTRSKPPTNRQEKSCLFRSVGNFGLLRVHLAVVCHSTCLFEKLSSQAFQQAANHHKRPTTARATAGANHSKCATNTHSRTLVPFAFGINLKLPSQRPKTGTSGFEKNENVIHIVFTPIKSGQIGKKKLPIFGGQIGAPEWRICLNFQHLLRTQYGLSELTTLHDGLPRCVLQLCKVSEQLEEHSGC
jgi:hypothetical protein